MTLDPAKIDWPLTISLCALTISILSPSISFYVAWRDRAHLKITSDYYPESRSIKVRIVNAGRRPIVLRMIGSTTEEKRWFGTYLDSEKGGGVHLEEHQLYEHRLTWEDTVHIGFEGEEDAFAAFFWVEDTLGNRYPIPNSRKHIREMNKRDGQEG